ncbi:MAG: hypothetical protein KatS3mg099_062 [Candidatus Parcubacteria bacterium]|nr:MAG: hypothetical protein KatS3mg099_062 [Candidatus Parcubacteria bacterium]
MRRKNITYGILGIFASLFIVPLAVFGQNAGNPDLTWLATILNGIGSLVRLLIPIVFALILLAFFWGLAKFVFSGAPEGKEDGKNLMLWSVIALFVAASIWGIVNVLQGLFGIEDVQSVDAPTVPGLP